MILLTIALFEVLSVLSMLSFKHCSKISLLDRQFITVHNLTNVMQQPILCITEKYMHTKTGQTKNQGLKRNKLLFKDPMNSFRVF